jgi:hypothetical protein
VGAITTGGTVSAGITSDGTVTGGSTVGVTVPFAQADDSIPINTKITIMDNHLDFLFISFFSFQSFFMGGLMMLIHLLFEYSLSSSRIL